MYGVKMSITKTAPNVSPLVVEVSCLLTILIVFYAGNIES